MGQASDRLRNKFMGRHESGVHWLSDGIPSATSVIVNAGGSVSRGRISGIKQYNADVDDAVDFLCDEWGYYYLDEREEMIELEVNEPRKPTDGELRNEAARITARANIIIAAICSAAAVIVVLIMVKGC